MILFACLGLFVGCCCCFDAFCCILGGCGGGRGMLV